MFHRFPSVLSEETYLRAWSYVSHKFVRSRQCRKAEDLVERTGHYLFLVIMLFFVNGFLYTHLTFPYLREFYDQASWFCQAWNAFRQEILLPVVSVLPLKGILGEVLCCFVLSWILPMVPCFVIYGTVLLVYRPSKLSPPRDPASADGAQALLNTARAATAFRPEQRASSSSSMFFLLGMILVITLFLLGCLQTGRVIFSAMPVVDLFIACMWVLVAIASYAAANAPLALMIRQLCQCTIPESHLLQMEDYLKQYAPAAPRKRTTQPVPHTDPSTLPKGIFARAADALELRGFPDPITEETFLDAWDWAERSLRRTIQKVRMHQVSTAVSQPLFAAGMLLFVFDVLCQADSPLVQLFLSKFPRVVSFRETLRPVLYPANASPGRQALAWVLVLYGIPFVIAAAAALLSTLSLHPKSPELEPEDPPVEQARQLCLTLREARSRSRLEGANTSGLWNVFFGLLLGILVLGAVVFSLKDPALDQLLAHSDAQMSWILIGFLLVLFIGYRAIALPLTLSLRLLFGSRIPQKALILSEEWFLRCENPEAPQEQAEPISDSKE